MINIANKTPKILVIGDLMIDYYLWGSCQRISPEAPVPVVNINQQNTTLGGGGNVISNLEALGAQVGVISVIGNCANVNEVKTLLDNINISTKHLITQEDRITSKKSRVIASGQQIVRYDQENDCEINPTTKNQILEIFKRIISDYDSILLSDYGKGVLTNDLTKSIIATANKHHKKVLVDPKGINYNKYKGAYLLTPNKKEASIATNIDIKDTKSLSHCIKKLKKECDLAVSLITLSAQGIAIFDNNLRIHPTVAKEVFDVTGAGDTVLAALGFGLSCGLDIDESVKFANLAAGVVVNKIGSATATMNEIIAYESSLNKSSSDTHIKTWDEINSIVKECKHKKQKIVFTNGCFDLLHIGHIKYLEAAKNFGDVLIIGLNSDTSTANIKGSKRPINGQGDRAYLLAALEVVDFVVIFNEPTPYNLIKLIKPNVLVKGSDYQGKKIVGEELVDELKLVQFIDGKSTSKTIKQIQQL